MSRSNHLLTDNIININLMNINDIHQKYSYNKICNFPSLNDYH